MHVSLRGNPHAHNLPAPTHTETYIWQTVSGRAGQLAGVKLDPWVPHCSMGLKAILKGISYGPRTSGSAWTVAKESSPVPATPLEDCICSRAAPWPLYVRHDISSHAPICRRYRAPCPFNSGPWRATWAVKFNEHDPDCVHQCLTGLCECLCGRTCLWMHRRPFTIYGSAYKRPNHSVCGDLAISSLPF